jgi:adenosine deaminase
MSVSADAIRRLPKAELHLHLEGSLEPDLMFELARRNRVPIRFETVEQVAAAYSFSRLQDFLDIYYEAAGVLQHERDFADLTSAYLDRVAADGVRHVEVFFDPQTHTDRGLPIAVPFEGILSALQAGEDRHGITWQLIPCILRHLDEEAGLATLRACEPWFDRILGIGLDSSEVGHPPSKFLRLFQRVREAGLKVFAHAGEEGPPAYVAEALDLLRVDRIDHGNRALEDPALVERIRAAGLTLTVCPLSNLALCVVDDLRHHPLRRMLDLGLRATVNSDDPAFFGGYVGANYEAITSALDLDRGHLATLARNSFEGARLRPGTHGTVMDEIAAWEREH